MTIGEDGKLESAIWPDPETVPLMFRAAVSYMKNTMEHGTVTDIFVSEEPILGTPRSRVKASGHVWNHLHVENHTVWKSKTQTAFQQIAEKHEDVKNMHRAMEEFNLRMLKFAMSILNSDKLFRAEKVIGPATWFHDLLEARNNSPKYKENLLWRAVALAGAGFAHPRKTMIGTLLEDIQAQMSFEDIARRFAVKMDPSKYQHPTALPTEGNVKAGEKLIKQLGAENSLKRRHANMGDLKFVWTPPVAKKSTKAAGEGVFGSVKTKNKDEYVPPSLNLNARGATSITWAKFARDVLPQAVKLEAHMPREPGPFFALTAAVDPSAPPILQWDSEEERNHVTVYTRVNGSPAHDWNLVQGTWVAVRGVTLFPWMWNERVPSNMGKGAIMILEGAKDLRSDRGEGCLALFPEVLRSEFRPVAKTIEAFNNEGRLEDFDNGDANGIAVGTDGNRVQVRVTTDAGLTSTYVVDRWE